MRSIYLDYNSTTPLAGAVRQAMLPFLDDFYAAPGHPHWQSRAVEEAIEDSRANIASMLGCLASEVVFTSGGTESNNLAILGTARALDAKRKRRTKLHCIISAVEHGPVVHAAKRLETQGWEVTRLPCSKDGRIDPVHFQQAIQKNTRLISIQLANAHIGAIQDIAELAHMPRPKQAYFHTDATQVPGKRDIDVDQLGVDLLSVSGHRMYGPKGVGALYVRNGIQLQPLLAGSVEEHGLRPGLQNPMLIVGFGIAAQLVKASGDEASERLADLKQSLSHQLRESLGDDLQLIGDTEHQLPNTLCFTLKGCRALTLFERMPELHIGFPIQFESVSEESFGDSPFAALELTLEETRGVFCASTGWNTTHEEIDVAASMICEAYHHMRSGHPPS